MGTEGPPDEWVLSGLFSYGYGQSSLDHLSAASKALLGPDEAKRFAASAPRPNVRYHYRGIASDQAVAAADLLPQRSQAYAAVLCWAARFATDSGDQEKATAIYKRYVATGAYQSWASEFGWTCVDPDFEGARSFWQRRAMTWIKQMSGAAWRHSGLLAAIVLVVGGIVVAAGWSRRRLRGF